MLSYVGSPMFLALISIVVHPCKADKISDLQAQIKNLAQGLQNCQRGIDSDIFKMKLHRLDANTTCNDGSTAGYYLKTSYSKRWIIYLEGGWFCTNRKSCDQRANSRMRNLMTSRHWRNTRTGQGMLSSIPKENPNWWNANHVMIPYCSSDAWSGNVTKHETGEKFSFLGSRIIDKVIDDLLTRGLYGAQQVVLAGSSAGAIGVLLNVDRVSSKLRHLGFNIDVRGLVDSGWYVNNCSHGTCGPANTIKEGMRYWRGVVPGACAAKHPSQPWNCYFANVVYPTLNASTFIFQWLYDETQLALDLSGLPKPRQMKLEDITLLLNLGRMVQNLFRHSHVHSVFAPSCLYHTILTDNNWLKTKVDGYTLDDAVSCWMHSSGNHHHRGSKRHRHRQRRGRRCKKHLVDSCDMPQCNRSCPMPRDPYTGKPYMSLTRPGMKMPGVPINMKGHTRTANDRGFN